MVLIWRQDLEGDLLPAQINLAARPVPPRPYSESSGLPISSRIVREIPAEVSLRHRSARSKSPFSGLAKSHRLIFLAHPCDLTPIESYSSKKAGGGALTPGFFLAFSLRRYPVTSLLPFRRFSFERKSLCPLNQ